MIGALVGVAELVSRYRDAPSRALHNWAAALYVGLNATAAVAALALIRAFDWKFGASDTGAVEWTRALVAGFGAMALFRSALFIVRAGDQDVGIGPSGLLQVVLSAADRAVDRGRAGARALEVTDTMAGVSFDRAAEALPAYCLALMQNATEDEKVALGNQVICCGNPEWTITPSAWRSAAVVSLGDDIRAGAARTLDDS